MAFKKRGAAAVGDVGGFNPTSDIWHDPDPNYVPRAVFMDIKGPEGTGRTTLALGAPGPIALIHADEKVRGITEQYLRDGKRIREHAYNFVASEDHDETAQRGMAVWNAMQRAAADALTWARTVVIDTGTEAWEMVRLANFGTLKPQGRTDDLYGPVNAQFRSFLKQFRVHAGVNIITIHQLKDEYKESMKDGRKVSYRTGKSLRAGFKEMGYMADVVVDTNKEFGDGGPMFSATVSKGWFNAQSEGLSWQGEDPKTLFLQIMTEITGTAEPWV